MSKFTVGTRVQIIDEHHRTGEVGYIQDVRFDHKNNPKYLIKLKDRQVSSFLESQIIERPYSGHLKKTIKDYVKGASQNLGEDDGRT